MASNTSLVPEHARSALNRLSTAGERMAAGWDTKKTEIAGLIGQLGQGELGAAFLAGYRQLATEVADAVDQCCRLPGEFAAAGNQAVTRFAALDSRNKQAIQSNQASPM